MSAWVLSLILLAAPTPAESGPVGVPDVGSPNIAPPSTRHLDWLVVPLTGYDPDNKLAYGLAAQFQWAGDVQPYRYQLGVQALFTTGGVQSHWIRFDAPHFWGSPLRIWARLEYHRDLFSPYYGSGNSSSSDPTSYPTLTSPHLFAYDRILPLGRLGASLPIADRVWIFAFANFKTVRVNAYASSLLEQNQPLGVAGGKELEFSGGAYYDSRDRETVPTSGELVELTFRGVLQGLASDYGWSGATLRLLAFRPLTPRLVLAMRFEGDVVTQGAPFFELPQFGGLDAIDGVGGTFSVRGLPLDRYVGQLKTVGTLELRTSLGEFQLLGQPANFGTVLFVDLGRVWQPVLPQDTDSLGIHPGYGGGFRLWRRAFVLRADLASSPDRPFSAYLGFGQFF